jgi:hypothetical protein
MNRADRRPDSSDVPTAAALKPRRVTFLILSLALFLWLAFLIALIARDRGYFGP